MKKVFNRSHFVLIALPGLDESSDCQTIFRNDALTFDL
jgi:hypothetical protein